MNLNEYRKNLLGKYVKFNLVNHKKHFGRVSSIEQDIVNIRGVEQSNRSHPEYHYDISEITICSHDEVFKLGQKS